MSVEQQPKNKSKSGLIGILAVVIIAAGGAMAYMSQSADDKTDMASQNAPADNTATTAPTESPAEDNAEVATAAGESAPEEASSIVVEPGNPVVARVGGKDITRVDVYRYIKSMPQNVQQLPAQTIYPLALEQTINTRIVQNKANEANLTDDAEIQMQLEMAKQQIIRNAYLQREVAKTVSEGDIKKAYNDFIKAQADVEERQASHILLSTEEEAKAAIERLNKGEDFASLAAELSTGPTGPKGGDLGFFTKTDMVPEFANAAFSMKKGDVSSAPVQTQFGYHVIKVVDVRDQAKPTLEEMTPAITAELNRVNLEKMMAEWRKNVEVETFDINGKPLTEGQSPFGGSAPASAAGE